MIVVDIYWATEIRNGYKMEDDKTMIPCAQTLIQYIFLFDKAYH